MKPRMLRGDRPLSSAAYQIAQVYGGGLIPILAGLILDAYGVKGASNYVGLLVMLYAVAAILAILATPETKPADLEAHAAGPPDAARAV